MHEYAHGTIDPGVYPIVVRLFYLLSRLVDFPSNEIINKHRLEYCYYIIAMITSVFAYLAKFNVYEWRTLEPFSFSTINYANRKALARVLCHFATRGRYSGLLLQLQSE